MLECFVKEWSDIIKVLYKKSTHEQRSIKNKINEIKKWGGSSNLWLHLIHLREQRNALKKQEQASMQIYFLQSRYKFVMLRLEQLEDVLKGLRDLPNAKKSSILLSSEQYQELLDAEIKREYAIDGLAKLDQKIKSKDFVFNEEFVLELDNLVRMLYKATEIFYKDFDSFYDVNDSTGRLSEIWMITVYNNLPYEEYIKYIYEIEDTMKLAS